MLYALLIFDNVMFSNKGLEFEQFYHRCEVSMLLHLFIVGAVRGASERGGGTWAQPPLPGHSDDLLCREMKVVLLLLVAAVQHLID